MSWASLYKIVAACFAADYKTTQTVSKDAEMVIEIANQMIAYSVEDLECPYSLKLKPSLTTIGIVAHLMIWF